MIFDTFLNKLTCIIFKSSRILLIILHYSLKYFLSALFLLLHDFKYVSFKEVSQNSLHNFHWYKTELLVQEQDIFVPRKKNQISVPEPQVQVHVNISCLGFTELWF